MAIIGKLKETKVKNNLYYEMKDKVVEETTQNGRLVRATRRTKVYGLTNDHATRNLLIELLRDRMSLHKDKFISPTLHKELTGLEVKKNGKVEHSDLTHDDQIFSYLMALYVWYEGKNLRELFGIEKFGIKTEEDIDDIVDLDTDFNKNAADLAKPILDITRSSGNPQAAKLELDLGQMNKGKGVMFADFLEKQRKQEEAHLQMMLKDTKTKEAYARHYGIAPDAVDPSMGKSSYDEMQMSLPVSLFTDFHKDPEEMDAGSIYLNLNQQPRQAQNYVYEDESMH